MEMKTSWLKLMLENYEKILDKIVECNRESYGGLQGWYYDVEMDRNGNVWVAGPRTEGQLMSNWNEETLIVDQIPSIWFKDENYEKYLERDDELYNDAKITMKLRIEDAQ